MTTSRPYLRLLSAVACLLLSAAARAALQPAQLAVVINDDDPNSVQAGEYYRQKRGIPDANMVHVRIPGKPRKLSAAQFRQLKDDIDARLGPHIQGVLMVWTAPYAVECNGITAAYTLGYDSAQCAKSCAPGKPSAYFNAPAGSPFSAHGLRPSMLLPTESLEGARALIDRGVAAGFRVVPAGAYFLATSQAERNTRAPFFPRPGLLAQRKLTIHQRRADVLEGAQDVIVYQTGMDKVDKLDTLRFLPGALADHLTSFGGDLLGATQMSSLRWLEAGATASYGTVSEPCNYWQKFPHPTVLLRHYLNGDTALEAYWKSVSWPAQGVFVGEPLAAPYRK